MKYLHGKRTITFGERAKDTQEAELRAIKRSKAIELTDKKALLLSSYNQVRAYLSVFEINPAYLEDAVQDTMIEAMTSIDSLKDVTKLKYWMLVIAKRVGLKYVAATKSDKECSYEEYVEKGLEMDFVSDRQLFGYISRIDDEELAQIINETLSEKEKKVIILYYVYDHKLKDIAEMIGESDTNTRTISARAKKKLKAKLEEGGYHG